jgi:hypothetical protein
LEIYEAAFDNLYRRQTTVDDVNLLTLFGAFAFENKLEEQKAKLSGVWKGEATIIQEHCVV